MQRETKIKMKQRRNLEREGLEMYLLYLLLGYRPIFLVCSLLLMLFSISELSFFPIGGWISFGVALMLVLVSTSFRAALYLAKIGAWAGSMGKKNDRK